MAPYPPARDGIGSYTKLLRDELVSQGHEAVVMTARPAADPPSEAIGSVPLNRHERASMLTTIREYGPDVVHVQFAVAAYGLRTRHLLRFLACMQTAGYPIVVTLHEVTRDTQALRALGRLIYRRICTLAEVVIVHTASAKSCLESFAQPDAIGTRVIPHPTAIMPASTVTPDQLRATFGLYQRRVVLSFGFIEINKGLHDLVRAAALTKDIPDVSFVIAGSVRRRFGPFRIFELRDRIYRRVLARMVARARMSGRVVFVGYVPDGSVASWFELADLVALPYKRSEQSGVANLAVSAGVNILTSTAGELSSLSALAPITPGKPREIAAELEAFFAGTTVPRPPLADANDITAVVAETVDAYLSATAPDTRSEPEPRRSDPRRLAKTGSTVWAISVTLRSAWLTLKLRRLGIRGAVATCEGLQPRIYVDGECRLGRIAVRGLSARSEIGAREGGLLRIGDRVFINQGASIVAHHSIAIGDDCRIGDFAAIYDTSHHAVDEESGIQLLPTTLGRNVWVGRGAVLLPGVTVGDHAVIGAGAVVTRDVAPRTLVVGNPARWVRDLTSTDDWRRV